MNCAYRSVRAPLKLPTLKACSGKSGLALFCCDLKRIPGNKVTSGPHETRVSYTLICQMCMVWIANTISQVQDMLNTLSAVENFRLQYRHAREPRALPLRIRKFLPSPDRLDAALSTLQDKLRLPQFQSNSWLVLLVRTTLRSDFQHCTFDNNTLPSQI